MMLDTARAIGEKAAGAARLAEAIRGADRSRAAVTIIGAGLMGRQYLQASQALGIPHVRVCSRRPEPLAALCADGVETVAGGVEALACRPKPDELGIVATPTAMLVRAAERLSELGFRRLLIEKPVSLEADEIERLAGALEQRGVQAWCAFNRVAYPSFHEVRARIADEGGATSCVYTLTERIKPDWPQRFPAEELARWGIANSLHVVSMAHGLIGWPSRWNGSRAGAIPWHPTGVVFVGSGMSERGVPFAYQADWGSTGRWSVEAHTRVSSYRLCPLEQVFQRTSSAGDWTAVPVAAYAPHVKAGLAEQVAAALDDELRAQWPLVSLREAARLTRYGESIFGYDGGGGAHVDVGGHAGDR